MSDNIMVTVVHNGGAGYAGQIPVPANMTLPQLYTQELGGLYREAVLTVNGKRLTADEAAAYVLQPHDNVVMLAAAEKNG
jgi:hypothetical protein